MFQILFTTVYNYIAVNPNNNLFYETKTNKTITFHGQNVVVKEYPYVVDTEKEYPDYNTTLNQKDIDYIQKHGWNIVRLGVQMAGVMPEYNQYNDTYLDVITNIINNLGQAGIQTLIDFHQDLLSEYSCGEGFANYAIPQERDDILPFPLPVGNESYDRDNNGQINQQECHSKLFSRYYSSDYVQHLFDCLFNSTCNAFDDGVNQPEQDIIMQTEYVKYWDKVSKTFANNEYVIGYDLLNEPNQGSSKLKPLEAEQQLLYPLYQAALEKIIQNDKNHLIFFEPFLDALTTSDNEGLPGDPLNMSPQQQVFDWHMYCETVNPEGGNYIPDKLCNIVDFADLQLRINKAKVLGVAQIVSEFGAVADTDDFREAFQYDVQIMSQHGLSWCHWAYKYYWDDRTTAFNSVSGLNEGLFYDEMSQQAIKVLVLSHPYAKEIAADLSSTKQITNEFDFDKQQLTLEFVSGQLNDTTVIVKSPMYINFGKCYKIIKGGDSVNVDVQDDQITITNTQSGKDIKIVFY